MGGEAEFEAGIKLAALFHQFIGVPVSEANAELLEKAMESCVKLQPYVIEVEVRIDRGRLKRAISSFGYTSLTPEMLYARVCVDVKGKKATAILEWSEEAKYPMMKLI
ncbi:MAG TPA: dihydroneopterin aldolase [Archaeoglobus veneficus]|nr:MAG: dihydroneopterin aldolase [Archaeoglobales archaeon]HDM60384.1 dihydroneopterin aldolase [Archaeoglobus veneficus]